MRIINKTVDLNAMGGPDPLPGSLFEGENQAHTFLISATRGQEAVTLTGTVTAVFDHETKGVSIPLDGEIVEGAARVTLSQGCYMPGRFALTIYLAEEGRQTALYQAKGVISRAGGGAAYDPGSLPPSLAGLTADYPALEDAVDKLAAALGEQWTNASGTLETGTGYKISAPNTPQSMPTYQALTVAVGDNKKAKVTGRIAGGSGGNAYAVCMFLNSSYGLISYVGQGNTETDVTLTDQEVAIPNGCAYIRITSKNAVDARVKFYSLAFDYSDFSTALGDIAALQTAVNGTVRYVGAIPANADLNTYGDNGRYGISYANSSTLSNKPSGYGSDSAMLVCLKGGHSGTAVTTQILFIASGDMYIRLINNSDNSVIKAWKQIGGEIAQATGSATNKLVSQKAVTDALATKAAAADLTAVNDEISKIDTALGTKWTSASGTLETGTGYKFSAPNTPLSISTYQALTVAVGDNKKAKVTGRIQTSNSANQYAVCMFLNSSYALIDKVGQGSTSADVTLTDYEVTIPAGCAYIRITSRSTVSAKVQFPSIAFNYDALLQSAYQWGGKKIVVFGDSRTWYNGKAYTDATKSEWEGRTCVGYQQRMAQLLQASVSSQGVSGDTSAQICTRIRAFNFSSYDAVFLEGGVNDYVKASQVTVGAIAPIGSTFDTNTIYGAWQSAIEYIQTNYPSVKIYMDIPAIAWTSGGVFPYNTAKIKGEIAELYNIPCLDLYKNAGINEVNRDYWYCDDVDETGWRLHFNDHGNALIGAIIGKFIDTH